MCGILGFSGDVDPTLLGASLSSIVHRGPDDSGVFLDPDMHVGIGHVRLSILDLSSLGHQPMVSDDGNVFLVFNGEIYNFRELRAELESAGHRFRGRSDTEVVLKLYLVHGVAMLSRLNGIFAFAIWDRRKSELFLARDALGVKPLYYAKTPNALAFCSEIKGLLALVPELRELDAAALHRYLSCLWCPGEGTPLKGVRKLAPGEAMVAREGSIVRRWTWYRLPTFRTESPGLSEGSAIASTADGLRQAVQRQLVADVPVGAFLSGGLDSSAVVAFAREQVPDIRCFTIESVGGVEGGAVDDLPYARQVARHLRVPLDVVQVDATKMADDLERMVVQLDEPLADPAALNVLYISRLARENGIKVMLSGAGGDDLFTGYRRHVAVKYQRYWNWLPRRVRHGLDRATSGLDQRNPLFRRLAKLFAGSGLDGDERIAAYFLWAREGELFALYSPGFRALIMEKACQPMLDFLQPLPSTVKPLDRMLALEQRFFLSDHNLLYTDKMSMAVGVEVRVPFLDLDLVEHAARVPLGFKQRGRMGKWVLKKAMEPYLPQDVIYRRKSGFGAPLRRWMRSELRAILGDLLSVESLERRGLFNAEAVQQLIRRNDTGQVDAAYTLLGLLNIEIWCRAYIDKSLSFEGNWRG